VAAKENAARELMRNAQGDYTPSRLRVTLSKVRAAQARAAVKSARL